MGQSVSSSNVICKSCNIANKHVKQAHSIANQSPQNMITCLIYTGCNTLTNKTLRDTKNYTAIIWLQLATMEFYSVSINPNCDYTLKRKSAYGLGDAIKSHSVNTCYHSRDNVLTVSSAAPDTHSNTTSQPHCKILTCNKRENNLINT
jgi:Na+/serine symporter